MPYQDPQVVVASASRTASGNSGSLNPGEDGETLHLLVNVTAVTGTSPTMVLSVEWSADGTIWATPEAADAFASLGATATKVKSFERKGLLYRVVWTLGGTSPNFTFTVTEYLTS